MAPQPIGPWNKEFDDLIRALSGAFLFGTPLLFTMEMWWIGAYAEMWKLLIFLTLALGVNVVLAHFTGFKPESRVGDALIQAVEALAVGIVASVAVLIVLNRIAIDDPLNSILGKIIIQAIPLSIGASVANAVFSGKGGRMGEPDAQPAGPLRATLNDLGATAAGAIFLGFSIAPTEEIKMLATEINRLHEIALIGLSLLISYIIVFESEFSPSQTERGQQGPVQQPVSETAVAYIVALVIALTALLLFDQVTTQDPIGSIASQTIVLGLPTAIGGAAGRLVI